MQKLFCVINCFMNVILICFHPQTMQYLLSRGSVTQATQHFLTCSQCWMHWGINISLNHGHSNLLIMTRPTQNLYPINFAQFEHLSSYLSECILGVGNTPVDTINHLKFVNRCRFWTIISIPVSCSRGIAVLRGHVNLRFVRTFKH